MVEMWRMKEEEEQDIDDVSGEKVKTNRSQQDRDKDIREITGIFGKRGGAQKERQNIY